MKTRTRRKPLKKTKPIREARLTIDCSIEQRKKIRMLAALEDKSMTDLILSLVDKRFAECPIGHHHIPNEETRKALEASERNEGVERFTSLEDFWKAMGQQDN